MNRKPKPISDEETVIMPHEPKAKHTPGPWTLSFNQPASGYAHCWFIESSQGTVAHVFQHAANPKTPNRNLDGNARLIAAAPALLEALQGLFEHCSMIHSQWGDGCNQKQADAAKAKGLAAIAKATGIDETELALQQPERFDTAGE